MFFLFRGGEMIRQSAPGNGQRGFFQRGVFLFISILSSLFVTFLWIIYSVPIIGSLLALDFGATSLRMYFTWLSGGVSIAVLAAFTSRFVIRRSIPRGQWLVLVGLVSGMLAFVLLLGDQLFLLRSWLQGSTWLLLGPVLPYLILVHLVWRGRA